MLVFLSFVNPAKPRGSRFLGACVVEVPDNLIDAPAALQAAIQEAFQQGCNPGGEVMGFGVDPRAWKEEDRNRLILPDELRKRDLAERIGPTVH